MTTEIFGRIDESGNVHVLNTESGEPITRINANIYPIGSMLSVRYEHPNGIVITQADAQKIGLKIENV